MPKKTLLLSALSPTLFTAQRIMSEASKLKYSPHYLNPYQFHFLCKEKKTNGLFLHRTTGTNYDDFDLIVAQFHQQQGMKVSNPLDTLKTFRTKDQQALFFFQHRLPMIATILYRGSTTAAFENELGKLAPQEKYILKMTRGNQGIGVNFLESKKSLLSLLETFHAMKDQRFIIQPYIAHAKEWRLFIVKGKILACIEKSLNPDDFRGNAKRSIGKNQKKISREVEEIVLKAFLRSGLDYAGIDLLESNSGELLLLEINPVPGFEQAEKLSKINIARELLLALGS